jgi:hypothetical protein
MSHRTISRKVLTSALALLAAGASLTGIAARSEAGVAADRPEAIQLAQVQRGRYGPYPTARRANEVAGYFRSLGYNTQVYPEWGAYYVSVW